MIKEFCDLCGKEKRTWEDSGSLKIVFNQSCSNPLARLKFSNGNFQRCELEIKDLCFTCQRVLSEKMFNALKDVLM